MMNIESKSRNLQFSQNRITTQSRYAPRIQLFMLLLHLLFLLLRRPPLFLSLHMIWIVVNSYQMSAY